MGNAIDGLISGLDTTTLINNLMTVEARPQTILKASVATSQKLITALQGLNSQVAALATLATTASKPAATDLYAATSSSTSVTTTVSAGAGAGQIDVVVGALAKTQVGVSAAMTEWATTPAVLTVLVNGVSTEISLTSSSLEDVVTAVNAAGAGVTATRVASGLNASGDAQYRLQFTATGSGLAGGFSIYQGTKAEVAANTAPDLLAQTGAAITTAAKDASITLWAGTLASQTITSSTNTFANLLQGVAITVSAESTTPVTIKVTRDDAAISSLASGLVSSLNGIFALVSTQTVVTNSTNASGAAVMSPGVFTGDSGVRDVSQKLLNAASAPINGHSPSEYGISITKTGTMEFDPAKFATALAADPTTVKAAVQEIATRVAAAAVAVSDKYTGALTNQITGQQSSVKDMSTRISAWDISLATRRSTLQATYTALEVSLAALKAQSTWLTAQVAAIPTTTTSAG
ncbi:flagellar filament capping protein FliD [Cryobacterium zhongshanensis]|uniref:Flagellar hook-associated protein 2 n=1 Tax=Cryobacterium zhongshanensis TaxID=2928153 RepID=A0AA41UFJ3_9MICO|nr:flagellar filament capping protein FliD [Cryobacterium zhongshanensis]MCI4658688.1 flagellar filament capping protein FliD [Cryobacterium zhongshanensis]